MRRVPYSPRVEKWTAPVPGKMLRGRLAVSVAARAAARAAPFVRAGEFRVITSGLSVARTGKRFAQRPGHETPIVGHLEQHAAPARPWHLQARPARARRRGPRPSEGQQLLSAAGR